MVKNAKRMGQRAKGKKREQTHDEKVIGLALGALLFALSVSAATQQAGKVARIGFLDRSTSSALQVSPFLQELSKLGWVEGKNISFEYRFAEGKTDRLPELAAELVRLKVDLIVTTGRRRHSRPRVPPLPSPS